MSVLWRGVFHACQGKSVRYSLGQIADHRCDPLWSMVGRADSASRRRSSIRGTDRVSVDGMSPADITTLATTVRPGEVVMYSTDNCTYCAEARSWLNQYGFAFKECNMDSSKQCEREFMNYGGNGTPHLVVRGHHMKNGFDSVEFLMALREKI